MAKLFEWVNYDCSVVDRHYSSHLTVNLIYIYQSVSCFQITEIGMETGLGDMPTRKGKLSYLSTDTLIYVQSFQTHAPAGPGWRQTCHAR